jgi:hypothetical protein
MQIMLQETTARFITGGSQGIRTVFKPQAAVKKWCQGYRSA